MFSTAWDRPTPIFFALGELIQKQDLKVEFTFCFASEDMGSVTGEGEYKEGQVYGEDFDNCSCKAYETFVKC
jgi:hypothetical protein